MCERASAVSSSISTMFGQPGNGDCSQLRCVPALFFGRMVLIVLHFVVEIFINHYNFLGLIKAYLNLCESTTVG